MEGALDFSSTDGYLEMSPSPYLNFGTEDMTLS